MSRTLAEEVGRVDDFIFISKRTLSLPRLYWLLSAKAKDTALSKLIDKKLLSDINPAFSWLVDKNLSETNFDRDIQWINLNRGDKYTVSNEV